MISVSDKSDVIFWVSGNKDSENFHSSKNLHVCRNSTKHKNQKLLDKSKYISSGYSLSSKIGPDLSL